jgi:hypothetical protein
LVTVDSAIHEAWREESERDEEPWLQMLFSPRGDHAVALRAVREVVSAALHTLQDEIWNSSDPDRFAGEWRWLKTRDGVAVQVSDCDIFEEMLNAVASGLDARGIAGELGLCHLPQGVVPRTGTDVLIAHIRLAGARRFRGTGYEWQPDPDAQSRVVAAGEEWCKRLGPAGQYAIRQSIATAIDFSEQASDRLLEGPVDNISSRLIAVADDQFRELGLDPVGSVELRAGGSDITRGDWRSPLAELTEVLRQNADVIAYAYIRRRWPSSSFVSDWPERAYSAPRAAGWTSESFEDVRAPDAFGIQLLGPGYPDLPDTPNYRRERTGGASLILEHRNLAAWFDAPFIPSADQPSAPLPPPKLLAAARAELAPILYKQGSLSRARYSELPGL